MNYLIIYAHPAPESKNAQLKSFIENRLKSQGHSVITRDLYALGFNPTLSLEDIQRQFAGELAKDVLVEQNYIMAADCLIFIHPIWWTGMPAILKGYIDRVFSYGFAYRYDNGVQKGLLKSKTAIIINTQGKSSAEYKALGMDRALQLTSDTGIYNYSGLELKAHIFFDQADRANKEKLSEWKIQLAELFDNKTTLKGSVQR